VGEVGEAGEGVKWKITPASCASCALQVRKMGEV